MQFTVHQSKAFKSTSSSSATSYYIHSLYLLYVIFLCFMILLYIYINKIWQLIRYTLSHFCDYLLSFIDGETGGAQNKQQKWVKNIFYLSLSDFFSGENDITVFWYVRKCFNIWSSQTMALWINTLIRDHTVRIYIILGPYYTNIHVLSSRLRCSKWNLEYMLLCQ